MKFRPPSYRRLPDIKADFPAFAEAYALRTREFYDARARWHRRFYRFSGVAVILAGTALPLLASLNYANKTIVVSSVGVLVAMLTGLRAFYRWDQGWVVLRQTEFALNDAYWQWKGSTQRPDDKAAASLLLQVSKIRQKEAEVFFKDLTFPDQKKPGG